MSFDNHQRGVCSDDVDAEDFIGLRVSEHLYKSFSVAKAKCAPVGGAVIVVIVFNSLSSDFFA